MKCEDEPVTDTLIERLRERAYLLPCELADRDNEAESHCGAYGTYTEADYQDDEDVVAMREAADRIEALEAENDRLSKAVGSGILGELLNDEETDEFVKFIKFLRSRSNPT